MFSLKTVVINSNFVNFKDEDGKQILGTSFTYLLSDGQYKVAKSFIRNIDKTIKTPCVAELTFDMSMTAKGIKPVLIDAAAIELIEFNI